MPEARASSYYSDTLTHAYLGLYEQLLLLHSSFNKKNSSTNVTETYRCMH